MARCLFIMTLWLFLLHPASSKDARGRCVDKYSFPNQYSYPSPHHWQSARRLQRLQLRHPATNVTGCRSSHLHVASQSQTTALPTTSQKRGACRWTFGNCSKITACTICSYRHKIHNSELISRIRPRSSFEFFACRWVSFSRFSISIGA